ncbi:hypothetical protein, partial [uncultured Duncaniella sp.]
GGNQSDCIVLGSSPSPSTNFRKTMKRYSEERTEAAVRLLIENLTQNLNHSGIILDEFEATHNDRECDESKQYAALVAGHFALKDAVDKINNELNKK